MIGKPFQKGQSGNPGGRKVIPEDIKELARGLSPAAITTLGQIMQDRKAAPAARVSAASTILDRAYGKAPQHITAERVDDLSNAELADELAAVVAGLRALGIDPALPGLNARGAGEGASGADPRLTH